MKQLILILIFGFSFVVQAQEGIYKKYTYTGIPEEKVKTFTAELQKNALKGVTGSSVSYDPTTQTLTYVIQIDKEEMSKLDTETKEVENIEASVLTAGSTSLGKAPLINKITDGSSGLTARDRCRQFIAALQNRTNPTLIGIPDQKTLETVTKACKAHWKM